MEQDLAVFKDKKILITGGGGYLGSRLAESLFHSGSRLYLLDIRFNQLSQKLITEYSSINKVEINLSRKDDIKELCERVEPDIIYHFGALLSRDRDFNLYEQLYSVNVQGTLNLLNALRSTNYQKFIFSSTSEVYGTKNSSPFHEKQIPEPASPYSLSKLMAEELIKNYSEIYGKPFTILRIFNFFGEDMPENFFLSQMIASLKRDEMFEMTGGEQIRDFMHVNDSISAILAISNHGKTDKEIFNVCSGKGVKLKDIALKIASRYNKKHLLKIGAIPYRKNEVWEMVGNNSKLKQICDVCNFQLNLLDD